MEMLNYQVLASLTLDCDALKQLDVIIAEDAEHWWHVKYLKVSCRGPRLFIHIVSCCI